MKAQLDTLFLKIDALSLRERFFLCVSILACFLAIMDAVWWTPVSNEAKKLSQQVDTQSAELVRLRNELRTASTPVDAGKQVRSDIATADQRLEALNSQIYAAIPSAGKGPVLEDVLVQFLRKHEGLTLVGLTTLASVPPGTASTQNSVIPNGGGTSALPPELERKGLELKVKGPYTQLIAYVQKLEASLPYLRWGSMQLKSEVQPPELSLQVFVLGVKAP